MSDANPLPTPDASEPRRPLPPGTVVDNYVIQSVLGSGGFGITYLASHQLLGRSFALKEYFPNELSYRDGRSVRSTAQSAPTYRWGLERFVSEARSLARFKHPSIVEVVNVFEANETAYMVLAYEQGRDLGAWLKSLGRAPTQAEVDRILPPLLDALEAIHAHNLLHRDVAPDNILMREDGSPVLIDFGSAREAVRDRSKAMSAIIKRGYSPPEQYTSRSDLQGPWSDIYALAATLYHLLVGKMPTDATDRMLEDTLKPVAVSLAGAYRQRFLEAIDRGLAIQGKERPQSVASWRADLLGPGVAASAAAPPRPTAPATNASVPAPRPITRTASGRPDLSWLDEPEPEAPAQTPAAQGPDPSVRRVLYAGGGLAIGAVAGALSSIIIASAVATTCASDSCVAMYLPVSTAIGAIVGLVIGLRLGALPPEPHMDDPARDA